MGKIPTITCTRMWNAESQEYSGYFCGFCLWQLIRLFVPGLEVHPIFIYIYGMMEIRETSEKKRKRKDAYFGYVDRRWCGTPYHVFDRLALGAVPAQAYRH